MQYDFKTIVRRENRGSLKRSMTPPALLERGLESFAAGEMDYATAPSLRAAVEEAAKNGLFGFTLKDEGYLARVSWWMKKARDWEIQPEWVTTAYGTIFSVATCIRAFVAPTERIIVQPPYYTRYKQAADRLGRETVYNPLRPEGGLYRMDLAGLERQMADRRNRLLILCNPHNPSGRVFTREELSLSGLDAVQLQRLRVEEEPYVFHDGRR